MLCSHNCSYAYEDLHECSLCHKYIEGKFNRVIYGNVRKFYHPKCFRLFIRYFMNKREEEWNDQYSCL